MPQNLPPGQKPLVLVNHNESTFNANDGKRQLWMEDGKQPLRTKARGNGLMVSDFLTPGGRLAVPDTISDAELSARLLPHRYATEYFIYICMAKISIGREMTYLESGNPHLQRHVSWLSSSFFI
jgi:hypothetical protein